MTGEEQGQFRSFRLPRGRHGIPSDEVTENQQWRLLGAATEVLAEQGIADTTVALVVERAGVSSSTFYELFEDIGDCLVAAYQMAADCVWDAVTAVCEPRHGDPENIRRALQATLRFLAAEPSLAILLSQEAPAGDRAIAAARLEQIERFAGLLRQARSPRPSPESATGVESHLIAGALALISAEVIAERTDQLPMLADELAEILTLPYGQQAGVGPGGGKQR